ncbi:hypothetical protein Droror1_Dr00013788 [Drosera rotundifolia]
MNNELFIVIIVLYFIAIVFNKSVKNLVPISLFLGHFEEIPCSFFQVCWLIVVGIIWIAIMGTCCSKEVIGGFRDREVDVYEHEGDHRHHHHHEHQVRRGDYGASVRLQGSSTFVAMATQQGRKGINQDAMTVWEDFIGEKDVFFCGVFDGHGPCGHKVARHVRENLPSKLSATYKRFQMSGRSQSDTDAFHAYNDSEDDEHCDIKSPDRDMQEKTSPVGQFYDNTVYRSWKASFVRAFREMDKDLNLDASMDCYCSGSTAVTVVKQGDHLVVGNLGDSRAVLCTRGDKGQVIPVQLTVDMKPSLPREAERIEHCKGRVFALDEDVLRVWLPDEDTPGLAMTRAFGDFCLKDYGLISVPQLFYRKLTTRDEFIVLATDGVWDVLTNLEVVRIVASARKRSMAAKLLVAHAVRAWKSRFSSSRIDDIAVVCMFFKYPQKSKSLSDVSQVTPDSLSHLNSSISRWSSLSSDDGFEFMENKIRDDEPEEWSVLGGTIAEEPTSETPQSHRSDTIKSRRKSRMRESNNGAAA